MIKRFGFVKKICKKLNMGKKFAILTILASVVLFCFLAANTTKKDIDPFFNKSVKEENYAVLTEIAYGIIEEKNIVNPSYPKELATYTASVNKDKTINIHLSAPGSISLDVKLSDDFQVLYMEKTDETVISVILIIILFLSGGIVVSAVCFGLYFIIKSIFILTKKIANKP